MVLRFSVCAGGNPGRGALADADAWRVVDAPLSGGEILIGRKPGSTIELPFASVSARHARVFLEDNSYRVEDLGSANGTFLGARRLQAHGPVPIAAGETLDVSGIRLRFDGELPDGAPSVHGSTDTLARRLVHDIFSACPPAESSRLVGLDGPGVGRELALLSLERPILVGRGEGCDLVLCDEDVSREHAAFERSPAGITLRDLDSKNGIEVQGQRLTGALRLCDGDIVRIGQTRLRLVDPEDRYLRQLQNGDAVAKEAPLAEAAAGSVEPAGAIADGTAMPSVQSGRSRLPAVARAVAVGVLLLLVGVVLALAFGT
jgi:pSer/pThr/pTyr-binding forkhead associated (FHA) protein